MLLRYGVLYLLFSVWSPSVAIWLVFKPPRSTECIFFSGGGGSSFLFALPSRKGHSRYFLDLCSDWTQIWSSSPLSESLPPGSCSWPTVADWGMSWKVVIIVPSGLDFCFRPEQISEARVFFFHHSPVCLSVFYFWPLFLSLSSSINPWVVMFLDCRHESPENPVKDENAGGLLVVMQQL